MTDESFMPLGSSMYLCQKGLSAPNYRQITEDRYFGVKRGVLDKSKVYRLYEPGIHTSVCYGIDSFRGYFSRESYQHLYLYTSRYGSERKHVYAICVGDEFTTPPTQDTKQCLREESYESGYTEYNVYQTTEPLYSSPRSIDVTDDYEENIYLYQKGATQTPYQVLDNVYQLNFAQVGYVSTLNSSSPFVVDQ